MCFKQQKQTKKAKFTRNSFHQLLHTIIHKAVSYIKYLIHSFID